MAKEPQLKAYRARERGQVKETGALVEPGEVFYTAADPGEAPEGQDHWMEPLNPKEAKLADALNDALDPLPDDVELANLSPEALEAIAYERGIDPKGLTKANLVDLIKASRQTKVGT